MELNLENLVMLLVIGTLVAMLARRIKIPYTIGLVLAGVAIALLPVATRINLTKDLIFTIFLPPLVFEAALYIHWHELRRDFWLILVLAIVGVLISAGITAVGMHFLATWDWPAAILFGTLIAATDPVSVIAAFREAGVRGRLRLLVEAESLFNDGTAAAVFAIALTFAATGHLTVLGSLETFLLTSLGGIICGALCAGLVILLAGRTNDHLVEISLTMVAAYGSFLLANHFGLSGVLATLTAGLMVGNIGSLGSFSIRGRESIETFWEFLAFIINTFVFILIGIREGQQDFLYLVLPIFIAILVVLISRAAAVYPLCLIFTRTPLKVKLNHQHVLFWGGLRGALGLALALGLPMDLPFREQIITVAFAVVAFSIIVQGLTITPLLRSMKELPRDKPAQKEIIEDQLIE